MTTTRHAGNLGKDWAANEFGESEFGDSRLNVRLVNLANSFIESPQSPINQSCKFWHESKAAYRFFKNDKVTAKRILAPHIRQTVMRAAQDPTVLVIQDTSYISYAGHRKTKGLGIIRSEYQGAAQGLVMHTSFAVNSEGIPLGIVDQNIFSRQLMSKAKKALRKKSGGTRLLLEEKESIRWLNGVRNTVDAFRDSKTKVVTVCDREGDFYDLYKFSQEINTSVLIRASSDRRINKSVRRSRLPEDKLWGLLSRQPCQGKIVLELPPKADRQARAAHLEIRFSPLTMNPPTNYYFQVNNGKKKTYPKLNAIYVKEVGAPKGEAPLEWMLLTDLEVTNIHQALEKIKWYTYRWRIEIFHKILKSGLHVEKCRLNTADRLKRYLTLMSVIAWRLYWITLINRATPKMPCTCLITERQWKLLYLQIHKNRTLPKTTPSIREVTRWIAQLGGFLARKGDGEPGIITIWRGWKRLFDLSAGCASANRFKICG